MNNPGVEGPVVESAAAVPLYGSMTMASGADLLNIKVTVTAEDGLENDVNVFCKDWILTGEVKRKLS